MLLKVKFNDIVSKIDFDSKYLHVMFNSFNINLGENVLTNIWINYIGQVIYKKIIN